MSRGGKKGAAKKGAANQPREAKQRGGKTTAGKTLTQAGRSRGGQLGAAVLRAKPAADRAAMFQKGWATRRAKAAAAHLAEPESAQSPPERRAWAREELYG